MSLSFNSFESFFTSPLGNGFQLESKRQQVSSSLQDSSLYSGRSQQCCSFDGFYSSSYFKVLHPCINPLLTVPSGTITTGITVTFMFYSFFQFSNKVYLVYYYNNYYSLWVFSHQYLLVAFIEVQISSVIQDSFKYSRWSQYCCVDRKVSFLQQTSCSLESFPDSSRIPPTMIGITATFMFQNFYISPARFRHLFSFLCYSPMELTFMSLAVFDCLSLSLNIYIYIYIYIYIVIHRQTVSLYHNTSV